MKGGAGDRLKAVAIFFAITLLILIAFTGTQPGKACARANFTSYLTVPWTSWEPMGYNLTGTAPWLDVKLNGWDAVKIMGNLGIYDGSLRSLNATSNPNINYTGAYLMAADVSMAPLDYSRMTGFGLPPAASEANKSEEKNVSTSNETSTQNDRALVSIPSMDRLHFNDNLSGLKNESEGNYTGARKANETGQITPSGPSAMALNDPYHSILMGRPVDDLLYEDPLILPVTTYARLVGFRLPSGCCVNIGTRCLSYGY